MRFVASSTKVALPMASAVGYRNPALAREMRTAESCTGQQHQKASSRATRTHEGGTEDVRKRPETRQRVPPHLAAGRRRPCRRRRAAIRADHTRLRGRRRRQAADRDLAGRLGRRHGQCRRRRAAHRHLRRAGRRRAQGLAARGRAHQQRRSAAQEDRAQGQQGSARQEGQPARRRQRRQAEPGSAGDPDLHQPEQDHADDRLDLERGRGRAQQVRAAREGALRHRHLRLERHHRQGLRALRLPPELLRRDGRQRDRSGAGQAVRQGTGRRRS